MPTGNYKRSKDQNKKISLSLKKQWTLGQRKGGWKHSKEWSLRMSKIMKGHKSFLPSDFVPWNKGKIGIQKSLRKGKVFPQFQEEKSPSWKGKNVGYRALHYWVVKNLGSPNKCEKCGKVGYGHQIHWASKDHSYERNLSEWLRLCVKCHKQYDKNLLKC